MPFCFCCGGLARFFLLWRPCALFFWLWRPCAFFCCGGLAFFFAVGALWVFFAVGALCFFAVEALHIFFAVQALRFFSVLWRPCTFYLLWRPCEKKNNAAGGLGGAQPPPICKHTARTTGFNKILLFCSMLCTAKNKQRGGWGGRSPPHLQTQCSYDGFQQEAAGELGGAQPPPFANRRLA